MFGILRTLGKAFWIVCIFFAVSGAYFLIKPTEEDKYLDQQLKMYPFGFHCTDENNQTVVMKFDMKSQIAISTENKVYKYSMKNGLYKNNEKKPFGCQLEIEQNGVQRPVIIYVDDGNDIDFKQIRYEPSDDKDLIYTVVEKSIKKKLTNLRTVLH